MTKPNLVPEWKTATQLANEHGMFFIQRGNMFRLFRKVEGGRPMWLGDRGSLAAVSALIKKCAGSKNPESSKAAHAH